MARTLSSYISYNLLQDALASGTRRLVREGREVSFLV
jgi:hypothetical protein